MTEIAQKRHFIYTSPTSHRHDASDSSVLYFIFHFFLFFYFSTILGEFLRELHKFYLRDPRTAIENWNLKTSCIFFSNGNIARHWESENSNDTLTKFGMSLPKKHRLKENSRLWHSDMQKSLDRFFVVPRISILRSLSNFPLFTYTWISKVQITCLNF